MMNLAFGFNEHFDLVFAPDLAPSFVSLIRARFPEAHWWGVFERNMYFTAGLSAGVVGDRPLTDAELNVIRKALGIARC